MKNRNQYTGPGAVAILLTAVAIAVWALPSNTLVYIRAYLGNEADQIALFKAQPEHSHYADWIKNLARHEQPEALFLYGRYLLDYQRSSRHTAESYIARAASLGDPNAQIVELRRWHEQQNWETLYQSDWLFDNNEAQSYRLDGALQLGHYARAKQLASDLNAEKVLEGLNKHLVDIGNALGDWSEAISMRQCHVAVSFIGNDWDSLQATQALLEKIQQHPQLSNLPVCWRLAGLPRIPFNCSSKNRLTCDRHRIESVLSANHLVVVMAEGGKANFDNGIMYLPSSAPLALFNHEFFHFFGFTDEYPLKEDLAEVRCLPPWLLEKEVGRPVYANLVYIDKTRLANFTAKQAEAYIKSVLPWKPMLKKSTSLVQQQGSALKLGTLDPSVVGIFPSETCPGEGWYKPVSQWTAMQYFELPMPELYWQLLRAKIDELH